MKLLIVGGAGYVGSIIVPALEKEFECTHFDRIPVKGAEDHSIIAGVSDDDKVRQAVVGMDAILYIAMGFGNKFPGGSRNPRNIDEINPVFDVNVSGAYRFLSFSLAAGTRRFIYASSLSVYKKWLWGAPSAQTDENRPADAWATYGMSKRTAEFICQAAAQECPSACITALRLIMPRNDQDWLVRESDCNKCLRYATGPEDTRNLFLKAINFDKPGFHLIQATGDMENKVLPNTRATEILGWFPENK